MSTLKRDDTKHQDRGSMQDHNAANDATGEEELALPKRYLWTSARAEFEDGHDCEFLGFEPCYTACIKHMEWELLRKIQSLKPTHEDPVLAADMTPMPIQYGRYDPNGYQDIPSTFSQYTAQLIEGLQRIRAKDEVLGRYYPFPNEFLSHYGGTTRRIPVVDGDRVRKSLADNIVLIVLDYIYHWDVANSLRRRFGNLSEALGRIIIGIVGGASFLVPMIIMTFVTQVHYRLVIISVATILFAIGVAFTSASKDSVVAATAAYAAVMVVYIGSAG